ncbi:oxidoreductase-like protein [Lizonia empirigonia]|nr:oxidoreductase-like protein [Lizonia empirigonia]
MAFSMAMGWSEGEEKMHELLRVPDQDNPTSTMLTPQASFMLQRAPLLAIGTLDDQSRPWTALWGGAPGFSEPIGGDFVGTRTLVDSKHDPVVQALVGGASKGEMLQPTDGGKMIAGLAIDLVTRKRVKLAGKMVAGTVREVDVETEGDANLPSDAPKTQDQIQLVTKIEQSMGNCPKYLNQYELEPALLAPELVSQGPSLSSEGKALIDRADMFFLSTAASTDMDTNHRGGPPGFVRIISPTCIIYPEYSGNRLYQSLGNLQLNPHIGITFPDYETGDVLYTTGTAEVLVGPDAALVMPGTTLAVKTHLTETRLVTRGLAFTGTRKVNGLSPYNPLPRSLASEGNKLSLLTATGPPSLQTAHLVDKTLLTPSIARFTFHIHAASTTTSSAPSPSPRPPSPPPSAENTTHFAITIRRVGPATALLFAQKKNTRFSLPLLGVGGEFTITPNTAGEATPFVAAGIGITPLLAHLPNLTRAPRGLNLLWAVRAADLEFVIDTLQQYPELAACADMFVSGAAARDGMSAAAEAVQRLDLQAVRALTWYVCAGETVREQVVRWLPGREVVFEGFDY